MPVIVEGLPEMKRSLQHVVYEYLQAYLAEHRAGLPEGRLHDLVMSQAERPLLELVLQLCGGNRSRAAEVLGINRNTLLKKMRAYGLIEEKRLPRRRRAA